MILIVLYTFPSVSFPPKVTSLFFITVHINMWKGWYKNSELEGEALVCDCEF